MGLNKSTGNMYTFVSHTYNVIKGKCPHNCAYCFCKRWGEQPELHFDKKELNTNLGEGNFIFVGSGCDMFANDIPREWIDSVLLKCSYSFNNKYLFQSKNPINMATFGIDKTMNAILCTTIETNRWYPTIMQKSPHTEERAHGMEYLSRFKRYVTIEPILDFDLDPMLELIKRCEPEQVNIGADSGNNNLPEPTMDKVLKMIDGLQKFTTIAQKKNLDRLLRG